MNSHLSAPSETAREAARQHDGKFGRQHLLEPPTGLSLSLPEAPIEDPVKSRAAELYTDPYPGRKGSEKVTETCGKCSGSGVYTAPSRVSFYTPAVGTQTTGCFDCGGTGKYTRLVSSARATARAAAGRAAEHEQEAAGIKARWELLRQEQQPLRDDLETLFTTVPERLWPSGSDHMESSNRAYGEYPTLDESEAQELHREVLGAIQEYGLRKPVPVSENRQRVVGEVLAVKYQESDFPGRSGSFKMLVEGDGWKVWGTRPNGSDIGKGDTVAFEARLKTSPDDPTFGFFTRPTKAEVLERAPVKDAGPAL